MCVCMYVGQRVGRGLIFPRGIFEAVTLIFHRAVSLLPTVFATCVFSKGDVFKREFVSDQECF